MIKFWQKKESKKSLKKEIFLRNAKKLSWPEWRHAWLRKSTRLLSGITASREWLKHRSAHDVYCKIVDSKRYLNKNGHWGFEDWERRQGPERFSRREELHRGVSCRQILFHLETRVSHLSASCSQIQQEQESHGNELLLKISLSS